ncbi:unnamed protein product [Callosobruchus maculatus]|uniref:URB1 C-terminal domain-containing protein n=1 Tax=Callosobruchus maculatus TaxID=64391 RepID=A0A653DFN5_CALMS|nr:unnamed protein product [Callosobruchus maculatus]
MEMFVSHSEFLDNVLGKNSDLKEEIMRLFLTFCQHWPDIMERSHLPVLFASYTAMVNRCDRVILLLLKMYESRADVTKFYDFKPFLWGKAAASHYSVRSNIENALWRQPKMSDVLDILQEHVVRSTIIKYPFKDNLDINMEDNVDQKDEDCYDLKFLLLIFSQLLAPEQQVQTYKFSRSGALSLTVVALSSQSTEVRHAACHILSRFRFHLEGRQTGKDNPLWIRYIDAVCKGTSVLPDFKLNHFAAIYLAKMAMVLTQPTHVMYLPLSQHLTAKSSLDFSTVPELYTFLHSPDVNFKEHRRFTLELLRDGLRTEKDFSDFVRSMAFKLISELYVSCLSDSDTKLLILDVFASLCKIPLAVRVLCDHHSFISQLTCDLESILSSFTKDNAEIVFISKILQILLYVVKVYHEKSSAFLIFMMLEQLLSSELFGLLPKIDEKVFYEVMYLTYDKCPEFYSKSVIDKLLKNSDDSFCKYVTEYGCKFVDIKTLNQDDPKYYLKLLVIKTLS